MKLLGKILVATDFSPGAHDALQIATFVARSFRSEIILLHVVPGSSQRYLQAEGVIRTSVEEELDDAADRIRGEGIEVAETVVDFGVPFYQINQQADERDVNIIILGARQRANTRRRRLGTTAAGVRRYASKSVWIVKPGTPPAIAKILCPVDSSQASGRALRNAIHLSRGLQAELTVLRVAPDLSEHEQRLFDRFVDGFDFHNVEWKKLIRRGRPHQVIFQVLEETKSDLLVMGSPGRTGLARMLAGGVIRKVARKLPCSILTVRTEHAIRPQLAAESTDVAAHFKQGHELLALGFSEEAVTQFQHCIAEDKMYAPAWEGLAAAHERLGRQREARTCEERAERIAKRLRDMQVQADVRSRHPLFRTPFGMKRRP